MGRVRLRRWTASRLPERYGCFAAVNSAMANDQYRLIASNTYGSATSNAAQLSVTVGSSFITLAGLANSNGNADGTGTSARFDNPNGIAVDSVGTLIRSTGPRVAAIGVDGLVIVATKDAVLVVPREHSQRVREASAWYDEEMLK